MYFDYLLPFESSAYFDYCYYFFSFEYYSFVVEAIQALEVSANCQSKDPLLPFIAIAK